MSESINQCISHSICQWVNQSINQSICQSIFQSINQLVCQSMNQWMITLSGSFVTMWMFLSDYSSFLRKSREPITKKITTTSIAFENVSPLWGFCVQHIRISTALWRSFVCRLKEYSRTKVNNSQWKRSANILLCRFAWKCLFFFKLFYSLGDNCLLVHLNSSLWLCQVNHWQTNDLNLSALY